MRVDGDTRMRRVRGLTWGRQGRVELTRPRILLLAGCHIIVLMSSPGINKQTGVGLHSGINEVEK